MNLIALPIQFVLLLLAQIFIFQHLGFGVFPPPHAFLAFLLFLPPFFQPWMLYLTAFLMGFLLDVSVQPWGANAASCVALVGLRGFWIEAIRPRSDSDEQIVLAQQSARWLLLYLTPLVFVYEFIYGVLVNLAIDGKIFLSVLTGTAYTTLICFLLAMVFFRSRRGRS